jgi:5-formyltetrahydrofolate cyclo-ligase
MFDKVSLRRAVVAARRALTPANRAEADRELARRAAALVRGRSTVATYVPMPGEPGGDALLPALAAVAGEILVPVLCPDLDLDWAPYDGAGSLTPSARGPREPSGPRRGRAAVASCDIVFVPALAVDTAGTRLGRGGGSYDRALARVPVDTPVVALLYPGELRDALPAEPHDRPVTAVLLSTGTHLVPSDWTWRPT